VRASYELSRVSVSCDEENLVSVAGLLPAAALAQKVGLAELVDARVRLASHGANSGTKALSVIGSMLAGGDSIDDVALLGAGATNKVFDQTRDRQRPRLPRLTRTRAPCEAPASKDGSSSAGCCDDREN